MGKPSTRWSIVLAALAASCCAPVCSQTNLIVNPGLEALNSSNLPSGWTDIWSRKAGAVTAASDTVGAHAGKRCVRVDSTGASDWSFGQQNPVSVRAGDIYEISGWVRCSGAHQAQLAVVVRGSSGHVLDWMAGDVESSGTHGWSDLDSRLTVPQGGTTIQFRLTGSGTGTTWLDDARMVRIGNLDTLRRSWSGRIYTLGNTAIKTVFDPTAGTLIVTDHRNRRTWAQFGAPFGAIVQGVTQVSARQLNVRFCDQTGVPFDADVSLPSGAPDIRITVTRAGGLASGLEFPPPFRTTPGDNLVLPQNEGMLYPTDDPTVPTVKLQGFCGNGGLSMPWAGVERSDGSGMLLLFRTPDDAQVDVRRDSSGHLYESPQWLASRGQFRYARRLTYVFFNQGGYVAQAKWYRHYAKETGLLVTLAKKRQANPNVDRLVGAVDVWAWIDPETSISLCNEMKSLGMDRVLWSNGGAAKQIAGINAIGYVTGKYDCYQDLYPPDSGMMLKSARWPDDLEWQADGSETLGWLMQQQRGGKTVDIQAGVCNSQRAVAIAKADIPPDLAGTPYTARFLDTDTASPWREDYNPLHPLTRSQDREFRMCLLAYCSKDLKLVTGSETGVDTAVPDLDYFEGMMSVAAHRVPGSGSNPNAIVAPTPETLKYQVGAKYRIPLFELVYHDCVVDYWYWGDFTNKMPQVWRRRDLFNILYGTPPLFNFDQEIWRQNEAHFAQTYKDVCPIVRRLGYREMLSHAFLTADHTVQQTRWSGGAVVTINLGASSFEVSPGRVVKPLGWLVSGSRNEVSSSQLH